MVIGVRHGTYHVTVRVQCRDQLYDFLGLRSDFEKILTNNVLDPQVWIRDTNTFIDVIMDIMPQENVGKLFNEVYTTYLIM